MFPGVLMIEGMAQTGGVLCILRDSVDASRSRCYFLTIDKAKFRKPVVPGDTIEYHMTQDRAAQEHVVVPRRGQSRRPARGRGRVGAMIVDA